jgi:hypothetical protein
VEDTMYYPTLRDFNTLVILTSLFVNKIYFILLFTEFFFIGWTPPYGGDVTLGMVDFAIFPHVDHEELPKNTMVWVLYSLRLRFEEYFISRGLAEL